MDLQNKLTEAAKICAAMPDVVTILEVVSDGVNIRMAGTEVVNGRNLHMERRVSWEAINSSNFPVLEQAVRDLREAVLRETRMAKAHGLPVQMRD